MGTLICSNLFRIVKRGLGRHRAWLVIALLNLNPSASAPLLSAEPPVDDALLTVDRIFGRDDEFKVQDWGPARWMKDGLSYTTLEQSPSFKESKDIVRYNLASGRRDVVVSATNLMARGQSKPLTIEDYAWTDDGQKLLIFTETKRVWRKETRGDYWILDLKSMSLKKLGGKAAPSTLMFATLSPDSRHVAYVSQNNIFVQSLDGGRILQITRDGSDHIINGTSDWVNEEEFDLRNGFRWSPDGEYIAYWQFDTTGVSEFSLINYTDSLYPKVQSFAYPKVGGTNSACRLGVVKAGGGSTRWFQPSSDPRNNYIPAMEWMKDSKHVVFQQLNRLQNTNTVLCGDIRSCKMETLFTDRDDAWVDVGDKWVWLSDGKRFLWLSERDGWRHIYSVNCANPEVKLLTPGAFDATRIVGVDEKLGCVYFIASADNSTQRYLYRAPLDGRGVPARVSPDDKPGTHSYDLAEDGRTAFHTYSHFGQPPSIELVRLPENKLVRVLVENASLREKLSKLKAGSSEFFRVSITNGVQLDGWCMKPPDFDPARKYPVLIHVYGEPAETIVDDRWGGEKFLWHTLLAQQGYVVIGVDNRGTPAPRGRAWRKCVYRQIGILAAADQAAAVRQLLIDRPYLDPHRVGIWGWSGGGSMSLNAIFRYPDLYQTAMAIAFVCNQRLYDTVYQERYMGLPDDNASGYANGSPLTFAHQLKGKLLIAYGTGDDNCHYQNCELLINELVKQNKQFSLMSYPNRTHAIKEGDNTKRHLFETLTRFLHENLPAMECQTAKTNSLFK